MRSSVRKLAIAYGVALVALVMALLLRWLLDPVLADTLPLVTLYGAVAIAVWIGGYRPALLVVALGYLACAYLFMEYSSQHDTSDPRSILGLCLYLFSTFIIIGFGEALRRAQQRYRVGEAVARQQAELLRTTLSSIGDGVIVTDPDGCITSMNAIAEELTGWTNDDASGVSLKQVFRIVNKSTRLEVENPTLRALKEGVIVGLSNDTLLIAKDGMERPIEDSAAPIRRKGGKIIGCVLVFRDISERHRAEAESLEARRQIETTLESVTDGFIRYDRNWRIVYVNTEAERINKVPRTEMLGRIVWEVFPAIVGTKLETELRKAVAEQVTIEFENHYEPFGRWYSIKGYPTADGGLTTYIRDITEKKVAEEELRQSLTRERLRADELHTVMTAVPAIIWIAHDSECQRISGNRSAEELLRLPVHSNQSLSAPLLERPAGFKVMRNGVELRPEELPVQLAANGNEVWGFEEQIVFEDGTEIELFGHAIPLRDGEGGVRGSVAAFIDITKRKQAEQEVMRIVAESERQRRLYETILTNTPDFVYVFSLDHKVVYANDSLIKMWGRGYEGAIGKTFLEIGYEPWHAEMHDREIDEVRTIRQPIRGEVPFNGTNGRRIYDYIFVPIIGSDGEVEAVAGTTRDVTERKQAEADLRRLAAELSEAARRKDEFLATLAHELRNPLAPIRNGLEVLKLAGTNDRTEQARAMMERQLTQLVRLVDDLLDMSRVTSGKLELRRERVDLRTINDSALETSRLALQQAGHELAIVMPDEPIFVDGDATRLAQVVSNLLNNSAKYTHRGGSVRMSLTREDGMAVLVVADNGIGIPQNMLGKVFEMFTQVDRTLEKTTGGLGIGLSLVKGLVEMHGGTIEARSEGEGQGSEFIVRLPVISEVVKVEPPVIHEPVCSPSRCRILVADDNVDSAESLGQLLELLGNVVYTANDGLQAVSLAETFQPDVILLDIGMPKLNGYEACRRIRELVWGKNAILVAMTGWGQEEDKRRSHEAGFNLHLVKPVDPGAIEKLLSSLKRETA
jgi:PAS domain S-box-containing protein